MAQDFDIDLDDVPAPKKTKVAKPVVIDSPALDEAGLPDVLSAGEEVNLLLPAMQELGIRTDMTPTELFSLGIEFHNGAMVLAVKAGVAFIAAQSARADSETFTSWIEQHGLTKQRVYESIKLAKAYMAIPTAQRKSFIELGKKKAIIFAKMDEEQINELVDKTPEALNEFALMSRQEMAKRIKNLEASEARLRDEKEILERERKRTHKPGDLAYDPRTFEVRHESSALEYAARLHIDALQSMFNDVVNEAAESEEDEHDLRVAAIATAASAILLRAHELYQSVYQYRGDDAMPIQAKGEYMLTSDEVLALQDSLTIINANYARKKEDRIAERNADAPPRRGRPAGAKNKVSEG